MDVYVLKFTTRDKHRYNDQYANYTYEHIYEDENDLKKMVDRINRSLALNKRNEQDPSYWNIKVNKAKILDNVTDEYFKDG